MAETEARLREERKSAGGRLDAPQSLEGQRRTLEGRLETVCTLTSFPKHTDRAHIFISSGPFFGFSAHASTQALRDYNAELTKNSKHRETIDHLKSERKLFDNLSRKLNREIAELKKQTADIIEKSTQVSPWRLCWTVMGTRRGAFFSI